MTTEIEVTINVLTNSSLLPLLPHVQVFNRRAVFRSACGWIENKYDCPSSHSHYHYLFRAVSGAGTSGYSNKIIDKCP